MNSIKSYYDDVLRGEYGRLYKRHPEFPSTVMTCAIDDCRYDVVQELLANGVKVKYTPMFKFKWVQDKTALLGVSAYNLETEEELERKFKMIDFLLEKGVVSEGIIPKHLVPVWREFKGIKIGMEGRGTYFVFIIIAIIISLCLSFALQNLSLAL